MLVATMLVVTLALAGCGAEPTPTATPAPTVMSVTRTIPAGQLVNLSGGGGGDGGRAVPLTNIEYRLLSELSVNAGRALTHEQLLQRVWGPEHSGQPGAVRTFVKNLRRKLGDDADNPKYIHTELRVGYRMPKGEGTEGQATM